MFRTTYGAYLQRLTSYHPPSWYLTPAPPRRSRVRSRPVPVTGAWPERGPPSAPRSAIAGTAAGQVAAEALRPERRRPNPRRPLRPGTVAKPAPGSAGPGDSRRRAGPGWNVNSSCVPGGRPVSVVGRQPSCDPAITTAIDRRSMASWRRARRGDIVGRANPRAAFGLRSLPADEKPTGRADRIEATPAAGSPGRRRLGRSGFLGVSDPRTEPTIARRPGRGECRPLRGPAGRPTGASDGIGRAAARFAAHRRIEVLELPRDLGL
jgi:hypothetical protein